VTTWLKRNWNLLSGQVRRGTASGTEIDTDYSDQDIGPLLYAINPEREKLEKMEPEKRPRNSILVKNTH
jgi:hypothetical protein